MERAGFIHVDLRYEDGNTRCGFDGCAGAARDQQNRNLLNVHVESPCDEIAAALFGGFDRTIRNCAEVV